MTGLAVGEAREDDRVLDLGAAGKIYPRRDIDGEHQAILAAIVREA